MKTLQGSERTARIRFLKNQVRYGEYKVDSTKVAQSMIDNLKKYWSIEWTKKRWV